MNAIRDQITWAAIATAILFLATGCASTGSTSKENSRTNGVRLTMQVERGINSIVRYAVDRDGSVSYAGGAIAQRDDWSWTGMLTDDEAAQFVSIIREQEWERGGLDRDVDATGDTVVYRIDLWTPEIRERFRHVGESDRITPMHELLAQVTQRRNEDFMSTLPKPNSVKDESDSTDGSDADDQ